jgi:hypothetical protein
VTARYDAHHNLHRSRSLRGNSTDRIHVFVGESARKISKVRSQGRVRFPGSIFHHQGPGQIPVRERFPAWKGIETTVNNRALRSHELFGGDPSITRDEFIRYEWDRATAPRAPAYKQAILPVLERYIAKSDAEKQGLELLRAFDGRMVPDSRSAALAQLTFGAVNRAGPTYETKPDALETFREGVEFSGRELRARGRPARRGPAHP